MRLCIYWLIAAIPLISKPPTHICLCLFLVEYYYVSVSRPTQARTRDPIFCDTKIERAGGREVVSRSRSARHKRSPKPETQTKRTGRGGETVTAGSAKNYDYETHFVKSLQTAAAAGPEREQGGLLNSRHVLGSHCTALHCTAPHCTALHCLYYTASHKILCFVVLYLNSLFCTTLFVLHLSTLCCSILCYCTEKRKDIPV